MTNEIDYTSPDIQFFYDMNDSPLFVQNEQNLINIVGKKQLNSLEGSSLLDIFLSDGHVVEPHYHQNAAELVYAINGKALVALLNPFTKQWLTYTITPGQVTNVPRGWWHYEVALEDDTHLLAIFDAPNPEVILGSDLLALTPADIISQTYCINQEQWEETVEPVQPGTYIGPSEDCKQEMRHQPPQAPWIPYYYPSVPYPFYHG
ncbi:Cupin [Amphibacillus marinus]|uniref:Cupin n=1 Tax=Amphibacillus marinus TaxID=872970 RepID=A0A1H8H875_9BACI|nr:cupin domain-containing protein [Amphibacillus marinus]SEN52295.1 Cupin [Amphibacillus marinus]